MSIVDEVRKRLSQAVLGGPDPIVNMPQPRPVRHVQYGFPVAVVEPGGTAEVKVELTGALRATRLLLLGKMAPIRGHYKLKYSRLPLLDRDNVESFTRVRRWSNGKVTKFLPGKTVIAYKNEIGGFVREYLPSSVVYKDVDPLEYIVLTQMFCGREPAMPPTGEDASALFFGSSRFDSGSCFPTAELSMTLCFRNDGDVQVRVFASVMGMQQ